MSLNQPHGSKPISNTNYHLFLLRDDFDSEFVSGCPIRIPEQSLIEMAKTQSRIIGITIGMSDSETDLRRAAADLATMPDKTRQMDTQTRSGQAKRDKIIRKPLGEWKDRQSDLSQFS